MKRAKPSEPLARASSPLTALPSVLARDILLAAVSPYDQSILSLDNAAGSKPFNELACVCKEWKLLAHDAAASVALSTIEVALCGSRRQDLLALRRQLTLQRAYGLSLHMLEVPSALQIGFAQWAALFSCVPLLEEIRLDLLRYLTREQRGVIVRAVSEQCGRLQSLVVSPQENDPELTAPTEQARRALADSVYFAMEQAYKSSSGRGLERLCVCMRYDLTGFETTRQYLDRVINLCPNLELFDGYKAAVIAVNERTAYEQWPMDLQLWGQFCATLSKLKAFDWICVPFATQFFEIFANYPKFRLTSLTLTTPVNWNWDQYFSEVDKLTQDVLTKSGFGATARNAHLALRACPNLEELDVVWYNPVSEDETHDIEPFPRVQMIDPEIFGDEFCEAALCLCPNLRSFRVRPADDNARSNRVISTLTDRVLRLVATLPRLTCVELNALNATGDEFFDLAVNHAATGQERRKYNITFGDGASQDKKDMRFYQALTLFLTRLVHARAPLPCMGRHVTFTLMNANKDPVDWDWSAEYLAELKDLIRLAKAKHAGIELSAFAYDCNGKDFSQMVQFTFDTRAKRPHLSLQTHDRKVCDSIWSRRPHHEDDDQRYGDDYYEGDYYDDYYSDSDSDDAHNDDGEIYDHEVIDRYGGDDDGDMDEDPW